jgi:hypothetical protein
MLSLEQQVTMADIGVLGEVKLPLLGALCRLRSHGVKISVCSSDIESEVLYTIDYVLIVLSFNFNLSVTQPFFGSFKPSQQSIFLESLMNPKQIIITSESVFDQCFHSLSHDLNVSKVLLFIVVY